jgi:L,D-transpeptidase ErfK/SrfK
VGETTIVRKKVGPTWWPTESIRDELAKQGKILPEAVLPGPDNPLGSHALYLGFPQYLIHGTNQPNSIGMRVSHGCVRMYPEHIVELFEMVGPGTPVTIVHQRIKAGWEGNDLYIEVHPNIGVRDDDSRPSMTDVVTSLIAATSDDEALPAMNWEVVEAALAAADGVPVAVGRRPDIQTASHWMTAK